MKNIEKVKERVIKLLELAANNKSEAETLNALTKARELIGRYKLNEVELKGSVKKGIEPTRERITLNFKKKYMLNLADLISRHFPVEFLYGGSGNYRSCSVYGTKEDIDFAKSFLIAVDTFVNKETARIRAKMHYENKQFGFKKNDTKNLKLSYYYGFLEGLVEKLEKQNQEYEEEGFALALQTPVEVTQFVENESSGTLEYSEAELEELAKVNREHFLIGYRDGKEFSTNIITDEEKAC